MEAFAVAITIVGVAFIIGWVHVSRIKSNAYTLDEWKEQCEKDFKKYGPPPTEEDEYAFQAVKFLQQKGILDNGKSKWIITFEDGEQVNLVDLFVEFVKSINDK